MCEYLKDNYCKILKSSCPWSYFCNKDNIWKFKSEGLACKVKVNADVPKGMYKVCFEKHGNLYVSINNEVKIIENPFDEKPLYVKVYKTKSGDWKIRK